jgi:hypothetical protein
MAFPTLTDKSTVQHSIQASALEALAHFSTSDLSIVLPETPRQLLALLVQDPRPAHAYLLCAMMREEIDTMRRGLFKGTALPSAPTHQDAKAIAREKLEQQLTTLHEHWSQGVITPSLCSTGAIAALHCTPMMIDAPLAARLVIDLVRDIDFSGGYLWRLCAIPSWTTFFRNILGQDNAARAGEIANKCYLGICDQLQVSRIPAEIGNLILAMTGKYR